MVVPFDFLDSMAWDVAISAVLLGLSSLLLPYKPLEGCVDDVARNKRIGFSVCIGASGFYLFLSGVAISLMWPFDLNNGVYNVLFGGIAALGGLVLVAGSIVLYVNASLKPVTYLAAVAGLYGIVDAYAIIAHSLTSEPLISALAYLSFAAPAILSVPAFHSEDRRWRIVFSVFAFLFAAAWLLEASSFTLAHLTP
jgi:uncharacterized membrane protein